MLAIALFAVVAVGAPASAAGDRTVEGTLRNSADNNAPVAG